MTAAVLYQPEIPPNTGNIIRLCACQLQRTPHLVEPLGFPWEDKKLKSAGLDYHEFVRVVRHKSWEDCRRAGGDVLFAHDQRGNRYDSQPFRGDDVFVFGRETRGLPPEVMAGFPESHRLRPLDAPANAASISPTLSP